MIELIFGERGVNNYLQKKVCTVHSKWKMLLFHIDFFLENAMYGEMHILLYMVVFVSIKEF